MAKKYKRHSPKLQRTQILLNSDEHTGRRLAPALATVLGVSTKTVERVRCQFCEEGMALFEPKPRKIRSDKKTGGRVEAHLTALLCQIPPDEQPRWPLQLLVGRLVELDVGAHILLRPAASAASIWNTCAGASWGCSSLPSRYGACAA